MKFRAGLAAAAPLAAGSSHAESAIDKFLATDVVTASAPRTVEQRCKAALGLDDHGRAAGLIEDFLGRPLSTKALKAELQAR